MTPFLFEYYSQWTPVRYKLVYADNYEKAYAILDAWLNKTQQTFTITLATLGPIVVDPKT